MELRLKNRTLALIVLLCLFVSSNSIAQVAWVDPAEPEAGDLVTVYYDANEGTLPATIQINLHWGINSWTQPPETMWPAGTVIADAGMSVRTPMIDGGDGVWSLAIQTDETVEVLDFVFTNGSSWDNNNGQDWHIPFGEQPPPPVPTWHTFYYDTRSAYAVYSLQDINTLYLRGVFNEWGTTPFPAADERGVFTLDAQLPIGENPYKFFFNNLTGQEVWFQDPDNPNEDGGSTSNSLIIAEPDTLPYFSQVLPFEGKTFGPDETIMVSGIVRTADDSVALSGPPVITTYPETSVSDVVYDAETGVFSAEIPSPVVNDGPLEIILNVNDDSGRSNEVIRRVGVYGDDLGYHVFDGLNDATGTGSYVNPEGNNDYVDFDAFHITQIGNGDSIRIAVDIMEHDPETRVLLQISTDVNGRLVPVPVIEADFGTPEWNGSGLQMILADENSTSYNPDIHNRLITSRSPLEYGVSARYYNPFDVTISVADLEAYLGTYATGWYYGVFSFVDDGAGMSEEIDEDHGGIDATYDPDVFDMMFVDTPELQSRIISNYTSAKLTGIDNKGRGFANIEPRQIGPEVGSEGPLLRWITRNTTTLNTEKTIFAFTGDTQIVARIHHVWSDGEAEYVAAGVTGQFHRDVTLYPGDNTFQMEATYNEETSWSPVLSIELVTPQAPEAIMEVLVEGNQVTLDASQSTDPQDQTMVYSWMPDPDNPEEVTLSTFDGAIASFTAPETLGEYYFDLTITDSDENVTHARTLATVRADSIDGFDINKSAQWVEDLIVYEIYPRSYNADHQLTSVTDDMQRIADMGYTAIWFMPIYPGPSDHGYAITDYYGIEEDYGNMEDFLELIDVAHSYGIKIIMDMVINHSAVEHPFMQDRLNLREASNYWDYYDSVANSPEENYDHSGNYTYYYDWLSLPNFNYDNPDVRHYMIEMSKWWIEEIGIDGFRCDVAWGVQLRYENFWPEWRRALKTIKPEVFLLGEANVAEFDYITDRFDSAYDWDLHHGQRHSFSSLFTRSSPAGVNGTINNHGYAFPDYTYPFRFMENHDETRYISNHSVNQTTLAATLLLTIPGIPMIYAGQEVGERSARGVIDWNGDTNGLVYFYQRLLQARNIFPSIKSREQVYLSNNEYTNVYTYGRYKNGEVPVVVGLNFTEEEQDVTIQIPTENWQIQAEEEYVLNEIITNTYVEVTGSQLETISQVMPPYGKYVWVIADSVITMEAEEKVSLPLEYSLDQNYPNPFNPETVIGFNLPTPNNVKLTIYNLLGQKVATLVNRPMMAGQHHVVWNGRNRAGMAVSSGVYFYTMEAGDFIQSKKMLLLK